MALGDAILACLTERPMTGYELAKTFDASIGFFWKADHQQIYRELSRLRDRGHIQGREVVQSGKPNKLVYTLTPEGRAALRHWAARPSSPPSIKDDLLVRLYALDSVDIEPLRDRPDGAAGTPPRPPRPLRAHSQQAFPARHRVAGRYRQAAAASHRAASRAERGGMVRRGHRRLVRHLAAGTSVLPLPATRNDETDGIALPSRRRNGSESAVYRPGNFKAARPNSLTRYLP